MIQGNPVVTLVARIVDLPEIRVTAGGKQLCAFSVVTCDRKEDGGTWEELNHTYYRVTVWGRLADNVDNCELAKGDEVIIVGRLVNRQYESNGEKKRSLEVTATSFGLSVGRWAARFSRVARETAPEKEMAEAPL
jgi:single-strand DNA-binding protein